MDVLLLVASAFVHCSAQPVNFWPETLFGTESMQCSSTFFSVCVVCCVLCVYLVDCEVFRWSWDLVLVDEVKQVLHHL